MNIEVKTWLYDILKAINEIESFFSDRPKDFSTYQKDIRTKRAIERNIEIIGEAMNRILTTDADIELSNSGRSWIPGIGLSMVMIAFPTKLFGE